jgi:hypothetical protein
MASCFRVVYMRTSARRDASSQVDTGKRVVSLIVSPSIGEQPTLFPSAD